MQLVELYSVLELILSHFTMFQKQVPKKLILLILLNLG